MSDFDVKEKRFEEDIEDYLTHHGGYTKGDPKKFNRESGLEEDTFVEFIKTSQPKKWERYVKIYAENSEKQIIERFKREVKTTNLLNVMRHGFMDRGIKFYPIFWKPETTLNETTQMQYDANILHCTRQLHYSVHNENSIDIFLFANGIPVVSMELKCQFTGQDTTNAINQYKFDRAGKDAIFAFQFQRYHRNTIYKKHNINTVLIMYRIMKLSGTMKDIRIILDLCSFIQRGLRLPENRIELDASIHKTMPHNIQKISCLDFSFKTLDDLFLGILRINFHISIPYLRGCHRKKGGVVHVRL